MRNVALNRLTGPECGWRQMSLWFSFFKRKWPKDKPPSNKSPRLWSRWVLCSCPESFSPMCRRSVYNYMNLILVIFSFLCCWVELKPPARYANSLTWSHNPLLSLTILFMNFRDTYLWRNERKVYNDNTEHLNFLLPKAWH